MSYILDALRKAEHHYEQKRDDPLGLHRPVISPACKTNSKRWIFWVGLLNACGLITLGVCGWFWLHQAGDTKTTAKIAPELKIATIPPSTKSEKREVPTFVPTQTVLAYSGLPDEIKTFLPPLRLDVHVFAEQADQRFVLINGEQYRVGDEVSSDLRLQQIEENGAILNFRGQQFLLPLP